MTVDQADEVRAALDYDPVSGMFTWRHRLERSRAWNTRYAGESSRLPGAASQYELRADQFKWP